MRELLFPKELGRLNYFIRATPLNVFVLTAMVGVDAINLPTRDNVLLCIGIIAVFIYGNLFVILPRMRDAGMATWSLAFAFIPYLSTAFSLLLLFRPSRSRLMPHGTEVPVDSSTIAAFDTYGKMITNLRVELSAKTDRINSGQSTLTMNRLIERGKVLDDAEEALQFAKSTSNMDEQASALTRAAHTIAKGAIQINLDTTEELEAIIAEIESGATNAPVVPPAVIQELRTLATSARTSFEQARQSRDFPAATEALSHGKKALADAATLAKAHSLRAVNPA